MEKVVESIYLEKPNLWFGIFNKRQIDRQYVKFIRTKVNQNTKFIVFLK